MTVFMTRALRYQWSTSSSLAGGVAVRAVSGLPRVSRLGAGLCAKMGEDLRLRGVGAQAVGFRVSSLSFRAGGCPPQWPSGSSSWQHQILIQ